MGLINILLTVYGILTVTGLIISIYELRHCTYERETYLASVGEEKASINITETDMFSYANANGTWKRDLLSVISRYNYCRSLCNTFVKKMSIVGEVQNVAIVKQLYDYLVHEFTRLAQNKWQHAVFVYGSDNKRFFLKSYYDGAVIGLTDQFEFMQPSSEETALAVVHVGAINEFLQKDKFYSGESIRSRKGYDLDHAAFASGYYDGNKVSLYRQIDKNESNRLKNN